MSVRSIIEINHDIFRGTSREVEMLGCYVQFGNQEYLPDGVKLIARGHHTDNLAERAAEACETSS